MLRKIAPLFVAVVGVAIVACNVAPAAQDEGGQTAGMKKSKKPAVVGDRDNDNDAGDVANAAPGIDAAPRARACTPGNVNDLNAKTSSCPLFATDSPWNIEVAGMQTDPTSQTMIDNLGAVFTRTAKSGFDIAGTDDYPDYGAPLYYADASTKTVPVKDKYGWWAGFEMPMPSQAKPAVGTDHHLTVWNVATNQLFEVWDMVDNGDGTWSAGLGATFDANGSGHQTKPWSGSARAYGGALIAGAIRYSEIQAGVIDHALSMAYPDTRGTTYALGMGKDGVTPNIATHSDNVADANRNTAKNIPEGARLRLKAGVDIAARCGTKGKACAVIGTAMAQYGIYVVDTAAVATLYAEVLTGKSVAWKDDLHIGDAQVFAADDFEVLSLPATLTKAGN